MENHVVFGVSSVGKSYFIKCGLEENFFGPNSNVLMASDYGSENTEFLSQGLRVIHYNALRPFENNADLYSRDLLSDEVAKKIFLESKVVCVDILVAKPSTIIRRILQRYKVEPDFKASEKQEYPMLSVYEFICRHNLVDLYSRWVEFFISKKIKIRFFSTEQKFGKLISSSEAFALLQSNLPVAYDELECQKILDRFKFPYQGRDGVSRNATLKAIQPFFIGGSALDIGCAEGFFSFALERAGFSFVMGTEIKKERFIAACATRDVRGSRCHFQFRDIFSEPVSQSFDIVLLLNVIHHLSNPIDALRTISKICNKRLILEFPTLEDPKFISSVGMKLPNLSFLPLIGVSDFANQDQNYVFSDEAIRRVCVTNEGLFKKITFIQSPIASSRRIAICDI